MNARVMNENIKKDEYQMSNVEYLLITLAETITAKDGEKVWFTSVDLKYAFRQVLLNPELAKHCIFAIFERNASGIYCFTTGFYGLTVMTTELQRILKTFYLILRERFSFYR